MSSVVLRFMWRVSFHMLHYARVAFRSVKNFRNDRVTMLISPVTRLHVIHGLSVIVNFT